MHAAILPLIEDIHIMTRVGTMKVIFFSFFIKYCPWFSFLLIIDTSNNHSSVPLFRSRFGEWTTDHGHSVLCFHISCREVFVLLEKSNNCNVFF
jgi:hypothetical protein